LEGWGCLTSGLSGPAPEPGWTSARRGSAAQRRAVSLINEMTVNEAIRRANEILPGRPAPDGQEDPRWQAIIAVGEFVRTEPEAVWKFVERWGRPRSFTSPRKARLLH